MFASLILAAAVGQCPAGTSCPSGPVARTARYVASVPGRLSAPLFIPQVGPMPLPMPSTTPATASKPATSPTAGAAKIVAPRRIYVGRPVRERFWNR